MTPADALAVATVVFLWGFNIVVAKVGVGEISPFTLTFIRFALVALLLVPFFHPKKRHLPWIAVLALTFGVMHFGALFQAMTELDAGTTAILLQLGVPFTVLFAALLLKETVGPIRWVGIGIAFSGSAVIAGEPNLPGLWPVFLMFISMSGWALSNLVVKKLVGLHPLAMTGWLCLFTLPVLLPLVLFLEADQLHTLPDVSAMGWAALLYIAIAASIIAHSLWYGLLTRHPVTRVSPYALLAPVVGAISGVLVLGETLSAQKLIGGLITFIGVCVVEWGARRMAKQKQNQPSQDPEGEPAP